MISKKYDRVVLHLDLDAFYAQVETVRLGLGNAPTAVLQHNMLLAVSYSARPFGVKRGDTKEDALAKCPQLNIVPVDTINEKPNLTRYRDASVKIFDVLRSFGTVLERASIDEAYLDVTELVAAQVATAPPAAERVFVGVVVSGTDAESDAQRGQTTVLDDDDDDDEESINDDNDNDDRDVVDDDEENKFAVNDDDNDDAAAAAAADDDESSEHDAVRDACETRLWCGAQLAATIRAKVFAELGFTVSAGISFNKILAKIGSARNKPNNQTTILPSSVPFLFARLPVRKLPGLGGKLGRTLLDRLKVTYALDLLRFSLKELRQHGFDRDTAQWLFDICRGFDSREVRNRAIVKSVTAYKQVSRTPLVKCGDLIDNLAREMSERLLRDRVENQRAFQTLTLSLRDGRGSRSVSLTPLPTALTPEAIAAKMWDGLRKTTVTTAIWGLGLAAHNFVSLANMRSLSQYFVVGGPPQAALAPRKAEEVIDVKEEQAQDTQAVEAEEDDELLPPPPPPSSTTTPNFGDMAVEAFACPVCGLDLSGRRGVEASVHVDACLGGGSGAKRTATSATIGKRSKSRAKAQTSKPKEVEQVTKFRSFFIEQRTGHQR
jgi:nucleotidyltransferase/DNA polymerase involved in DNA repair